MASTVVLLWLDAGSAAVWLAAVVARSGGVRHALAVQDAAGSLGSEVSPEPRGVRVVLKNLSCIKEFS